jgi:hypothetical protein
MLFTLPLKAKYPSESHDYEFRQRPLLEVETKTNKTPRCFSEPNGDKLLRHRRNTQPSHIISCRKNERMAHCPVSVWVIPH